MQSHQADILIIGAGPAGLTAAIYAARAGKKTIVLEGERAASRMSIGWELENFPGYLSINSQDLLEKFRSHAAHFGAEFVKGDAIALSLEGDPKFVSTTDAFIEAKTVVLATGKPFAKERQIPGEERLVGYGVSYCAVCDGPLYRGREVAAYGASEEAVEDVMALNQMGANVHWITGKLKDPAALEESFVKAEKKGVVLHAGMEIREIVGEKGVEKLVLKGPAGDEELSVAAVFLFREVPTGPLFTKAGLTLDHKQCLAVDRFGRTNLTGVYAAGDNTCGGLQVVAAAGEGCVAALQALAYLRK
ncbi:MAG: FAD-dependent oxidoreductase [Candidatus Aminicenantes bacterium]|nr:FAD-dependent oxidoreductase [Candidatus Aminicenantes bacterium]